MSVLFVDGVTPLDAVHLNQLQSKAGGGLVSVKDYGAVGNGSTDDTAAINAAIAYAQANSGTLYFPSGDYPIGSALTVAAAGKRMAILGSGNAVLSVNFAAGSALTISGPYFSSLSGLKVISNVDRAPGSYLVRITGLQDFSISEFDTDFRAGAGGGLWLDHCHTVRLNNCHFDTGDPGATGLRLDATFACMLDNVLTGGAGQLLRGPSVWMTGVSTSNTFANCHFGGGGPALSAAIAGIASTASSFTVTTATPHNLQANDLAVIRNAGVATYNNVWRIASVSATTIVVNTTLNPGTAGAAGTLENTAACFYVDNSGGSVNESLIDGCLFESGPSVVYGTAAAYFNGRTAASNATLSGWTLAGCYADYGTTGILLAGQDANPTHQPTVYGFAIGGCVFAPKTRPIHLDRVQGIQIDNCNLSWPYGYSADRVSALCGLYIQAGPSDAQTRGITVRGCNLGWPRDFGYAGPESLADYGVILDGPGIQDLLIQGNQIGGAISPFGYLNVPLATGQRWSIKNNNLVSGTLPPANSTFLPSVTAAATVDLSQPYDTYKITGSSNIQTITGGWIGREIILLFAAAVTLATGGNLAVGANRAMLAGDSAKIVFDGTSWFVR